jgi:hypothetical protein
MPRFAPVAVALLCLALVGCEPGKPPAVPAGGKVTFKKSTPPVGALVVFHPTDPAAEKTIGGKPFGKVGEDGTFKLTSYAEGDGAPEGEYGVTIDWRGKGKETGFSLGDGGGGGGAPKLNPKYSNPQQPFTKVTVRKGEPNQFTFEVD